MSISSRHSFAYLFERFPSFVQTFCYREVEEMVRQGMNPLTLSIRRPDDPPDFAADLKAEVFYLPEEKELRARVDDLSADRKLPWRVRHALSKHRRTTDSQRVFEAAWLGQQLREYKIRHVHAHFGGMAARTACWISRLYGVGYSFTGHANDIFCDNDFPVSNMDLVREARFVVTETDYARHWMEERYSRARGKIFRIFNGIAMEGFLPRDPVFPKRILSVGRYVEKKGFADLIDACAILRERGIEFQCDIVGGGPLAPQLQDRVGERKLEGIVHLLGPRSQAEVRQLLAGASVFALACVPEEGGGSDNLPTVIMEAMAAGVPVVSTEVAGVPEMITNGQEGVLVAPHDPPALTDALELMLCHPDRAAVVGEHGRASAEAKFAIERTTRALKHLLVRQAPVFVPETALDFEPGWELPPLKQVMRKILN